MSRAALIVAGALDQATGGYRYDAEIVAGLRRRGWRVDVASVPESHAPLAPSFDAALGARPDGERVIVDGLVLGRQPAIAHRHAQRLRLIALIHHALADELNLDDAAARGLRATETRALAAVRAVVTTSAFTARRLVETGMTAARPFVIAPGTALGPLVTGSHRGSPRLICVATLTPRKGHDVLVDALTRIRDTDWRCRLIGAVDRDPAWAQTVRARVAAAGLEQRIKICGTLDAAALAQAYQRSDLFVLASHFEGYGMAVTEALAHGLPIVATTGGALVDTVPADAGRRVDPGNAAALAAALREMLTDRTACAAARAGARAARARLRDWPAQAAAFARVLDRVGPPA